MAGVRARVFRVPRWLDAAERIPGLFSREQLRAHVAEHRALADALSERVLCSEVGPAATQLSLVDLQSSAVRERDPQLHRLACEHYSHCVFWDSLRRARVSNETLSTVTSAPRSLRERFEDDVGFRSFGAFCDKFIAQSVTQFGSGWTWLVEDRKRMRLAVLACDAGASPVEQGLRPLLCVDVWEHAYYVDYRNDRARYVDQFLRAVDWLRVHERLFGTSPL